MECPAKIHGHSPCQLALGHRRSPKRIAIGDRTCVYNPDLGEDAIRRHLSVLKNHGVVEELVVPSGERIRGYPYKFYTLSGEAREMFDDNDLFPEDAWTRQYSRVEKTNEITELEQMPRPIHD